MISENNGQASTALHWIIGVHWAQWKSMQSSSLEYLIENDISHAGKDILDQARVSGRRHVRINGPGLEVIFALAQKGVDDEIGRFLKVVHATLKSKKKKCIEGPFFFFFGGLNSPLKLGNATLMLLSRTFSSNKSFLLKKTIKGISAKYTLLTISSKRLRLSCMRLTQWSSNRTWSYSDMATTNNTLHVDENVFQNWHNSNWVKVYYLSTLSKQWIHFLRSDLCPPTSNMWKTRLLNSNSIWNGHRAIIRACHLWPEFIANTST